MDRRRRHWAVSGSMAVGTHLAVIAGFFFGVSPHYQRVDGRPGEREVAELAIDLDLVSPVQAAPPPAAQAVPLVEPRPRRAHALHHARPAEATPPIQAPLGANPLEPPPLAEARGDDEAPPADAEQGSGGGVSSEGPALPVTQPISISSGEAGYLRTYENYPSLPRSLWVWGRVYSVLAQVCVSARGEVSDVSIKHGAAAELDRAVAVAMRSWRYRPRMVEGAPRPFCHLMKLDFSLR
jgi:outer membrane biosynthesis protein TonB